MPKSFRLGVSFLELIVVLGIIAAIGVFTLPSSQDSIPVNHLAAQSKLIAQKLVQLSIDARVSGRTIRLDCTPNSLTSYAFNKNQTYDYASAASGVSGLSVVESISILTASNPISLSATCPSLSSFYITSEGYFYQSASSPGIHLSLTEGSYLATIQLSGAGFPRVFIGNQSTGANNEL